MFMGLLCDHLCVGGLIAVLAILLTTVMGAILGTDFHPLLIGAGTLLIAVLALLWRIPRLAHAAMTLDELNETSELISTAWLIRDRADPWSAQLVAMAAQASRSMTSPRATGRFGWRFRVAIALALVATTLAGNVVDPHADAARTTSLAAASSGDRVRGNDRTTLAQLPRVANADPESRSPDRSTLLPDPRTGSAQSRDTQGDDASGAGRATAAITHANPSPHILSVTPAVARPGNLPGTGAGVESINATGAGDARGAVSAPPSDRVAPWLTPTWPAAQSAVDQALRAGEYPDAYRPLIRAYFER